MMIVMKTRGDRGADRRGRRADRGGGRSAHSQPGEVRDRDRRDRRPRAASAALGLEGRARRRPGRADPQALQAQLGAVRDGERSVLDDRRRARSAATHFALIAGPCTVESREQTARDRRRRRRRRRDDAPRRRLQAAHLAVLLPGARRRRGCGCSPRPRRRRGLPIVTELMDVRDLEAVLEVADVIQVGARNMQNYDLLTEIGRAGRPVLLKRGLSAHARGAR